MPFSEEELAQITRAVSDVVDPRFTALEQGVYPRFTALEERVQALARNKPEVALHDLKQHVVDKGTELEMDAIMEGADSTWTYMKHRDMVLAVSAAHCACDHRIKEQSQKRKKRKTKHTDDTASVPSYDITKKEFIEVPRRLAPFVTRVFSLPGVISNRSPRTAPRTHQDIVIVELQDQNSDKFTRMKVSDSIPVWRTVAGQCENIKLLGSPLAGVGLASIVRAPTCVWDHSKRYILFNPDNSEGGHSGTLMFDLQQRETQLCERGVGVLIGEKDPGGNLHPRGKACPLPNFDDLLEYTVVDPPPANFEFTLRGFDSRKPFMRVSGESHRYRTSGRRKQESIYGVFVDL